MWVLPSLPFPRWLRNRQEGRQQGWGDWTEFTGKEEPQAPGSVQCETGPLFRLTSRLRGWRRACHHQGPEDPVSHQGCKSGCFPVPTPYPIPNPSSGLLLPSDQTFAQNCNVSPTPAPNLQHPSNPTLFLIPSPCPSGTPHPASTLTTKLTLSAPSSPQTHFSPTRCPPSDNQRPLLDQAVLGAPAGRDPHSGAGPTSPDWD